MNGYVDFEYDSTFQCEGYVAGCKVLNNLRLNAIETGWNSKQLRKYVINYVQNSNADFVDKVTEFGLDNETHYNSTVFKYYQNENEPSNVPIELPVSQVNSASNTGDFNGDGKADILVTNKLMLNNGNNSL